MNHPRIRYVYDGAPPLWGGVKGLSRCSQAQRHGARIGGIKTDHPTDQVSGLIHQFDQTLSFCWLVLDPNVSLLNSMVL